MKQHYVDKYCEEPNKLLDLDRKKVLEVALKEGEHACKVDSEFKKVCKPIKGTPSTPRLSESLEDLRYLIDLIQ
jgi:hypothetical protein